jgi:hypothetical protein
MATVAGRCHCGNLEFRLETALAPSALPIRLCACTFCRRHGARTTSDPDGRLHLRVRASGDLVRYRFGLRTADFLLCAVCGVYVAAVMREGDRAWAIVNLNAAEDPERFTQPPAAFDYSQETPAERRTRRRARWTPLVAFEERT